MHMFYGSGFFGWGGMLLTMLFWLLLIGGIIYFAVRLSSQRVKKPFNDSALELLKRRYAAGEITREEFFSVKDELKDDKT